MSDDNPAGARYLQPEQLRVGIFVKLELSWFKHGFARSAFKISSEKQLREVLALRLPRYCYDPERSDAPIEEPPGQAFTETIAPTPDPQEDSDNPHLLDRSDLPEPPDQAFAEAIAPTPEAHEDSDNPQLLGRSDLPEPSGHASADAIAPTSDEHEANDNPHLLDRSDVPAVELPGKASAETMPPTSVYPDVNDAQVLLNEQQRARFLAHRELRIKEVEKSFVKATDVLKNLNRDLLSQPKETLEEMCVLVDEMSAAFLESPDVTLHIMGESVGGEDAYHHPLNVAILSMMLAKDLGFTSAMAQELGIGALVHDIGLMKIPGRVLMKTLEEYTGPERNLRAMHVEYGIEIGRGVGFSAGVLAVIAQHHEFADGSGYPNSLKEAAMTPAARVVSLVNYYDNLCNPIGLSKAMTPHEALSLMFAQRRSKFEARAMAVLIRCLGVYPPGSIVLLSNDTLATVISINPKISTRPCVLVYDEKVPKEKATILNLENELKISIKKSIRPATLPPKVAAYLNPRKRVTYFFDSNKQSESA